MREHSRGYRAMPGRGSVGNRGGWPALRLLTAAGLALLLSLGPAGPAPAWADGPWTANVKVNDDAGTGHRYNPAIAADGAGNAYTAWFDPRNGNNDICFAYRPAGGSWGTNARVNDDAGTAEQVSPAIAVDAAGNAYAAWEDARNGFRDIYFAYRPAGGSWGANARVNDDAGTATQQEPAIAVDGAGNAYAVWSDTRNGDYDIYFAYRPAGGSWGANAPVSDDAGTSGQYHPAIAVDGAGNAYAVWQDERNGNADIYFAYRPAGGSWATNARVNDDAGTATQQEPAIAVDGAGNAYAVWQGSRNGNTDIYFAYRPAGGSWGANGPVSDDAGTATQGVPQIAVDGTGNAYATWEDYRAGNWDIYFARSLSRHLFLPLVLKSYAGGW